MAGEGQTKNYAFIKISMTDRGHLIQRAISGGKLSEIKKAFKV